MPGSACDTPQPKRKRVHEPTSAMRRRLAEHGRSRWTQEQCESMTSKQLQQHLMDLGLPGRQKLTVSTEEYNNPDLSWEELQERKAAAAKEAAAAKAAAAVTLRVCEPTSAMRRRLAAV